MSDSNVINAQGRFKPSERDQAKLHLASLRQTQIRLEEADAVAQALCLLPRIPDADRPVMARNLGSMVEQSGTTDTLQAINALFQQAFGGQSSASALKKRKRYLRLSSEPLPPSVQPGEYHARGAEFVRLAGAWAIIKPVPNVPPVDGRRQAILKLVAGTSFDTRARATLRRTEAGRVELMELMDRLLARVDAEVGLESYLDNVCDLPLTITYPNSSDTAMWRVRNEELKHLALQAPVEDEMFVDRLDPTPAGEDGDHLAELHFLAPKVRLGFLYTPVRLKGVIPFTIPPGENPSTLISRARAGLVKTFGTQAACIFDDCQSAADVGRCLAQWSKMADDEHEATLWFRRPVFLTVYRERSTGKSRLALAVTWYYWATENDYAISRLGRRKGEEGISPRRVTNDESSVDVYVVENSSGQGYLVQQLEEVIRSGRTEHDGRLLFSPGEAAMDFAYLPARRELDSSAGTVFIPSFNDCATGWSPAPHTTIAGAILRNLAHAPIGERLDDQLLKDAREKVDAVDAFIIRRTEDYRAGIHRLK